MWRPKNKRAEMWLNGRQLLTPDPSGQVALRLDVDHKVAAQLRAPQYGTDASGRQYIEAKKDIITRMGSAQGKSPDRAEALLLAVYEPRNKKKAKILARGDPVTSPSERYSHRRCSSRPVARRPPEEPVSWWGLPSPKSPTPSDTCRRTRT